jgi:hypothetical protein
MTSTSKRNYNGNYDAEQRQFQDHLAYQQYIHNSNGQAYTNNLPGIGLLPGQIYSANLSHNNIDVESFLRGIGSANLVNPELSSLNIKPDLISLASLNIHEKLPVILPKDIIVEQNVRPTWS